MTHSDSEIRKREALRRKAIPFLVLATLSLLVLVIYVPAFDAPFIFDSRSHIENNEKIKDLWTGNWFSGTRWLATFSFALDQAVHGGKVWGFHLTNATIHISSAFVLFGLVYTVCGEANRLKSLSEQKFPIAFFSSLIWFAHPLQTQSVIYTVQRMESLMGLFALISLYGFVKSLHGERTVFWLLVSVAACYLSGFCKEVAICIPFLIFTFDFVFSADFKTASSANGRQHLAAMMKRRWFYYGCLLGVFLLFASPLNNYINYLLSPPDANAKITLSATAPRNERIEVGSSVEVGQEPFSAVIDIAGMTPLDYARNQPAVILHYIKLCFVPANQCLDYAWPIRSIKETAVSIAIVMVLLALAIILAWRRHPLGFFLVSFFVVLAPTSSFLPILDLCYEHRMYLPLAAIVVPSVALLFQASTTFKSGIGLASSICGVALLVLVFQSHQRCQVYRSRVSIWGDVVQQAPHNPRGYMNRAQAYYFENEFEKSLADYEQCLTQMSAPKLKIPPVIDISTVRRNLSMVQNNYGLLLLRQNQDALARQHFELAIENHDQNANAHSSLGNYFFKKGALNEAAIAYRKALQLDPDFEAAAINLEKVIQRKATESPEGPGH